METIQQNKNDEIEIDLRAIIGLLFSKLVIIILSGVLLAFASMLVTKFFITPQYRSTTKMYVLTTQSGEAITQGDMQASAFLTKDYVELIKSRTVTESVIAQLGLNMSHGALLGKLNISSIGETRVVQIMVLDEDPYRAAEIANAVRDVAADHIQKVMNIEAVNVVEEANIPQFKATPNTLKNTLLGGMAGMFIAVVIILIVYLTNDTIKSSEDTERYLGISVLGSIPMSEGGKKKKIKRKKIRRYTAATERK